MQQVKSVAGVVHVIEAVRRIEHQPEEGAGARRRAARIELRGRDLTAIRRDLVDKAIAAVDRENLACRSHGEPQRSIETAAGGERVPGAGRSRPTEGISDGGDAIVERVCDIEPHSVPVPPLVAVVRLAGARAEADTRW